ncbi:MAG: xanthine dehydrogenase family protein subunit M [Planctomycetes bacterium]|nr:xanthine dehydrogenase family protein subunit M [Planctomycetota bacterium]
MQMPDLSVHRPETLRDACELLKKYGEGARVLAGGTDLLTDLKMDRVTGVEHLVSIQRVPGLSVIDEIDGALRIGALATPNAVAADPRVRTRFPALAEAAECMASYPVRNMATVGGNIASAVPSSDLAPIFIAIGAEAILVGDAGERRVRLEEFFVGPRRTVRAPHEIITHLELPSPRPRTGFSYERFALRAANALAVAGVAAMIRFEPADTIAEAKVVLGAVAPIPDVARRTGAMLVGKRPSEELFREAGKMAREEARPISDIRGSKEYRRELVEVLAARALAQAAERGRRKE